jgi:excinuclease ABC subunit C
LVAVRDETHRFATGLSRKLREKDLRLSVLTSVDGIGEARAKKLIVGFGSLESLALAEVDEIAKTAGVSESVARGVKEKAIATYGSLAN